MGTTAGCTHYMPMMIWVYRARQKYVEINSGANLTGRTS
jgi:hypothetical protein